MLKKKQYKLFDLLRIPFGCTLFYSSVICVLKLTSGLVPTIQVIATANFIDTAVSIVKYKKALNLIYPSLFLIVSLIAYTWIAYQLSNFAYTKLELKLREKYRTAILEKTAKLEYRHIENNETWDLISRVSKTPETRIKDAYINIIDIVSHIMMIVGILGILVIHVWWAALLILSFSVPLFILAMKSGKANYETDRKVTKYRRKYEYLSEVLTGRDAVDERTLFEYGGQLNTLWHNHYEKARKIDFKTRGKWFIKMKTGSIITAFISFLIVLVLLKPVLSGKITIGLFMSLVNAVFSLVQMMSWGLTDSLDQLASDMEYLNDLTRFTSLDETDGAILVPVYPHPVFNSLEFKNVRFKYPGTDKYILDGLSLKLEKGRHYAFVGVNGAGKTTLTKLITGLYDEFEGEIDINGRNILSYDQSQLKSFFSIVYQDFAKYFITLKDNIALGNVNEIDEKCACAGVSSAIDQAGLNDVVQKLPEHIDTPLGKIKENGLDVSGGEWQRIAMARAIMNPAPVLILDEPTAALDPISESNVYEEFGKISRHRATIFISHRLGSTKLADYIYVIGNGRVIESGTHEQLMDKKGVYAEMYTSQRSWYK